MESTSIEYIIERNCDLTQIGKLLDEKGYGIAMRKSKHTLVLVIFTNIYLLYIKKTNSGFYIKILSD